MSWFAGGDEEVDGGNAPKRDYVPRFRVKVGAEPVKISFVDDFDSMYEIDGQSVPAPIKYKRHTITELRKGKKTFYNHYTCLTPLHKRNPNKNPKCPFCVEGDEPKQVIVLTIIDHTRWKDQGGKTRKDELKLFEFATGSAVHEYLLREHKKRGGLSGCTYEVSRADRTSPTVGQSFSYDDKIELRKNEVPLDYGKLLSPMTADELERALGRRVENDYDQDDKDDRRKPASNSRNSRRDDDDDDAPRKSRNSRPADDDDDDERPRKPARNTRDDDDEPRRSAKPKQADDDDVPLRSRGKGTGDDEEVPVSTGKKRASVDDDDDGFIDDAIPF